MPYSLPSMVAGSSRPESQVTPWRNSSAWSVRSMRPPLAAKPATCVLPRSSTSGGVLVDRAVVILVLMSFHCWFWMLTSTPVSLVNWSLMALMVASL